MHLLGARFRTLAAATMALQAIRAAVPVAPGDVGVRPLGSMRYDLPAEDFLLAGRFDAHDLDAILDIVRANDGLVIERRSELAGGAVSPTVLALHDRQAPPASSSRRTSRAIGASSARGAEATPARIDRSARARPRRPAMHRHLRAARERRLP